jgi:hypothetical protein
VVARVGKGHRGQGQVSMYEGDSQNRPPKKNKKSLTNLFSNFILFIFS